MISQLRKWDLVRQTQCQTKSSQRSYFFHSGPFLPKRSRKWEEKDFLDFPDLRFSGIKTDRLPATGVDAKNRIPVPRARNPYRMPRKWIREKTQPTFSSVCLWNPIDLIYVTLLGSQRTNFLFPPGPWPRLEG